MIEVVTLGALTAFLTAVGNGAAGEMGKHIVVSTGAQVRRALGRETPLPATTEEWTVLARQLHRCLGENPRQSAEWAHLIRSLPDVAPVLRPGPGLPPGPRHFTDRAQVWRVEFEPAVSTRRGHEAEGMTTLLAEAGNLVRAVSVAEEYQQYDTVLWLARALWPVQLKAGHLDEVLPALRLAARRADEHAPGSRLAGALHFQLGHCLGELQRWEEAGREARAAVACERAAGHVRGEASCVELLGLLHLKQWQYPEAYEQFVEAERIYGQIAPGQDGAEDLPRALALAERHQARALRGLGRLEESRTRLESVQSFFAEGGENYNRARVLTDLAETLHDAGDDSAALVNIAEAERLLAPEKAELHLAYLTSLRELCESTARLP